MAEDKPDVPTMYAEVEDLVAKLHTTSPSGAETIQERLVVLLAEIKAELKIGQPKVEVAPTQAEQAAAAQRNSNAQQAGLNAGYPASAAQNVAATPAAPRPFIPPPGA